MSDKVEEDKGKRVGERVEEDKVGERGKEEEGSGTCVSGKMDW